MIRITLYDLIRSENANIKSKAFAPAVSGVERKKESAGSEGSLIKAEGGRGTPGIAALIPGT